MYTIELTLENFIAKGGRVFERSQKIWSGFVHAGRIILSWNKQSKKHSHS